MQDIYLYFVIIRFSSSFATVCILHHEACMYIDLSDSETPIACHRLLHTITVSFKKHESSLSCTSNDGFVPMRREEGNATLHRCNRDDALFILRFICIPGRLHVIFRVFRVPSTLSRISAFG